MKKCIALISLLFVIHMPVRAEDMDYNVYMQFKYYNPVIDTIYVLLENKTHSECEEVSGCKLHRLVGSDWEEVPHLIEDEAKRYNIERGGSRGTNLKMDHFAQPFAAGTYRITKEFWPPNAQTPVSRYGYFQVMDETKELTLGKPSEIRIQTPVTTYGTLEPGDVTLRPGDMYNNIDPFSAIMQELKLFQRQDSSQRILQPPDVTFTIKVPSTEKILLYQQGFATYANYRNGWYIAPDTEMIQRIRCRIDEYGGFLPATGEALIAKLKDTESMSNLQFEEHTFSDPFPYQGWRAQLSRQGEQLSIFTFPDTSAANQQLQHVKTIREGVFPSNTGVYAVTLPDARGEFTKTKMYQWSYPPYYYQCGPLVILLNGIHSGIQSDLEALFEPSHRFMGG